MDPEVKFISEQGEVHPLNTNNEKMTNKFIS